MSKKINDKQRQILDFVNNQVEEKGYPPSVREICAAVGFKSTSTVHGYLRKLEENGLIVKDPTKPRALKVLNSNRGKSDKEKSISKDYYSRKELIDVPIVGKVTAGLPILAVENVEDTYPIPADFVQNSTAFMLRIQGDSMMEAGILNNDLVLVRQQATALNGDTVVALIGDEATVKTFYKEKDYVRLQPQNRYMDPIIVRDNLSILGKVIGVFRML
ncbi:MAG: transcriptional repressor LexA [Clostridiaceae bacterium]|jgi:repressor LexA|nr:transcriptional repressor LexA [Clostridiaceae bacterium]